MNAKIPSSADLQVMALNMAEQLSFGFARDALIGKLVRQYDVDYAVARAFVEKLANEVTQLSEDLANTNDLKTKIREQLFGANPLGMTYQRLAQQAKAAEAKSKDLSDRYVKANEELNFHQRQSEILDRKRNLPLGDFIKEEAQGGVRTY